MYPFGQNYKTLEDYIIYIVRLVQRIRPARPDNSLGRINFKVLLGSGSRGRPLMSGIVFRNASVIHLTNVFICVGLTA